MQLHGQRTPPSRRNLAKAIARAVLPSALVAWHGPRTRRRVALTFDDGPTELTREYMGVLERFGARGTFFVIGALSAKDPELIAEIDARGHGLGGHGYTHRAFRGVPRGELVSIELERTARLLPARARRERLVRPPFGSVSLASLLISGQAGFLTLLWSCDSGDWHSRDPDEVVRSVDAKQLAPGAIVLLHDGQRWTLDALPRIVSGLVSEGFELVTASTLLGGAA